MSDSVSFENLLSCVQHFPVAIRNNVGAQGHRVAAEAPHVQIVHTLHTWQFFELRQEQVEVNTRRRALHENVEQLFEQIHGCEQRHNTK